MIRLIRYLFLLVVILATSLYVVLMFIDLNQFKHPIEEKISSLLNRKVTVGQIDLKMSLVPKLSIKDLTIQNPNGFKSVDAFATVKTTDLTVSITPLIHGIFQVDSVHLTGAKINLIQNEQQSNWVFSSGESDKKGGVAKYYSKQQFDASRVKVEQISVSDAIVTYVSGDKRETAVLNSFALDKLEKATMQLNYQGVPVFVNLSMPNVLEVLRSGNMKDFTLNVKAFNGSINISGKTDNVYNLQNMNFNCKISSLNLGKTLTLMGENGFSELFSGKPFSMSFDVRGSLNQFNLSGLTAEIRNMINLSASSSVENLMTNPKISTKVSGEIKSYDITNKYGIKPLTVDLDALYENKNLLLNKLSFFINRSDVFAKGKVDFSGSVPFLMAEIHSNYFDLSDVVIEKDGLSNESIFKTEKGDEQEDKLDFTFLKKLNANLNLSFSNLKLLKTDKDYHGGVLAVSLKNGVLSVNPYKFDFLNGNIMGEAYLNVATEPMQAALTFKGLGLMISDLKEVAPHLRNSTANILFNVSSKGDTIKSLISALNGEVKLQISSGLIVNKWFNSLPGLIGIATKNSAFSYADTSAQAELNCAALKLDIKDGVVKSDKNIAIETSVLNLVVSGNIDFSKETLSLSLIPSLNHLNSNANKKLSFAQYIRLEGPFSDIKMTEDVKGALENWKDKELEKFKRKLTGVNSDKQETYIPVGGLCELALGEDIFTLPSKNNATNSNQADQKSVQKNKEQDQKESFKEQVKDQITKSLSKILKRK